MASSLEMTISTQSFLGMAEGPALALVVADATILVDDAPQAFFDGLYNI